MTIRVLPPCLCGAPRKRIPSFTATVVNDETKSRRDPTGTMPVQAKFRRDLDSRWQRLKMLVRASMPKLVGRTPDSVANSMVTGKPPVAVFAAWMDEALRQVVMGHDGLWTNKYVHQAAATGSGKAAKLIGGDVSVRDRTPSLQAVTITELQGICDAVSQAASRAFAAGEMNAARPASTTQAICAAIDKVGKNRGRGLVSFMSVKVANAAALDVYRVAGVTHVGVVAERVRVKAPLTLTRDAKKKKKWADPNDLVEVLTAGDDDVCPICEDLSEEGPYTLDQAEGLIPAHIHCRCAFVPAADARYAHDEFNPDEPRDPHGMWTSVGARQIEDLKHSLTENGIAHIHDLDTDGDAGGHVISVDPMNAGATQGLMLANGITPKHIASGIYKTHFTIAKAVGNTTTAPSKSSAIDMKDLTKVGNKMGSNEGGVYTPNSGDLDNLSKQYYIKKPATPDHVTNELLTAKLYQLAGVHTLNYVPVAGGEHVATEIEQLAKKNVSQLDPAERDAAKSDFAVHAWLANHDAAGTGGDNQGVRKNGEVVTLDTGGGMKYRAQGETKGSVFGDVVNETKTMRGLDPNVHNPDAAALYGDMTSEQLVASMKRVTGLHDGDIVKTVIKNGGDMKLANQLIKRKNDLLAQQQALTVAEISKPLTSAQQAALAPAMHPTPEPTLVFKTKMDLIKHHLMAGTTAEDLKAKLGWPSLNVPGTAAKLNLKLTKTKIGGGKFHYKGEPITAGDLVQPVAVNAQAKSPYDAFANDLKKVGVFSNISEHDESATKLEISSSTDNEVKMAVIAEAHPEWTLKPHNVATYIAPKSAFSTLPGGAPSTHDPIEPDYSTFTDPKSVHYVPSPPAHDITTPIGNFKASLDEHGVAYSHKDHSSFHTITITNSGHEGKATEIAKWHPDVTPVGSDEPETFFVKKTATTPVQLATATSKKAAAAKAEADKVANLHNLPEEEQREYWLKKTTSSGSYVDMGKKNLIYNPALKEAGVTPAEVGFIKAFTGSHSNVNEEMRHGFMSDDTHAFKHIMKEALDKMPKYDGDTVWRKIELNSDEKAKYIPGKMVEWRAFNSASKNPNMWSGNTHFTIRNPKTGVDVESISSNPSEAEVIMPADSSYRVLSRKDNTDVHGKPTPGVTQIVMEEVLPFGKKKLAKAA